MFFKNAWRSNSEDCLNILQERLPKGVQGVLKNGKVHDRRWRTQM